MKTSKVIIIALLVSAYATVSVINIQLAKPKDVAEVTVDMLDVMSRAFDESEGGEGNCNPPVPYEEFRDCFNCCAVLYDDPMNPCLVEYETIDENGNPITETKRITYAIPVGSSPDCPEEDPPV